MGKGGRSNITTETRKAGSNVWRSKYYPLDPKAVELPSKGDIKAAIPKECFRRSYLRSLYYVLQDCTMVVGFALLTSKILSTQVPSNWYTLDALLWLVGWNLYAFWMGCILTGLWVLAHECGHGAFSPSQTVNDIFGFVMHQSLLVPYFAWQYSHAKHHRRTNNLVDGESHVPSTSKENGLGPNNERLSFYAKFHDVVGDGLFAAWILFTHVVIGWPIYLMGLASTGRLANDGTFLTNGEVMDHFRPWSKMFPSKIYYKILLSTVTTLATLVGLFIISWNHGFLTVFLWYGAPYMWVNFWLVTYTWLQHTDPSVPQYGADEWTWVKGGLATIDRPYGIFDFFHHKIGSTHVAHHLFHEIPFYHADEATVAIKKYLEPKGLYNYNPAPWWKELWRVALTCHYVDSLDGVQYFRSFNDLPRSNTKNKVH
jgi:omega-6 fatty acid desaturase (delta-12 desaturase)